MPRWKKSGYAFAIHPSGRLDEEFRSGMAVLSRRIFPMVLPPMRVIDGFLWEMPGSFLDPIFSTGVSIALESGLRRKKPWSAHEGWPISALPNFRPSKTAKRFMSSAALLSVFYTPWFRIVLQVRRAFNPLSRGHDDSWRGSGNPSFVTRFLIHIFFGTAEDPAIHSNRANADPP